MNLISAARDDLTARCGSFRQSRREAELNLFIMLGGYICCERDPIETGRYELPTDSSGNMFNVCSFACVWRWACLYVISLPPNLWTFYLLYRSHDHPSLWIIPELQPRLLSPLPIRSQCNDPSFLWTSRDEMWEPVCLCGRLINLSVCSLARPPSDCCSAKTPKSILQQLEEDRRSSGRLPSTPNAARKKFIQYRRADTGLGSGSTGWKRAWKKFYSKVAAMTQKLQDRGDSTQHAPLAPMVHLRPCQGRCESIF